MSAQPAPARHKKITVQSLQAMKARGEKISMLTAYDYPTALAMERAGLDIILVGDSLGMVVLGYESTLPVTMEDMLHHCKAVARGIKTVLAVGDMPFLSYQISPEQAVRNAGRFLQEGGMDAVKLEGGANRLPAIKAILGAGIPVMGHLGLTPQSVHQMGGYGLQAKTSAAALQLLRDAQLLQDAGCFALVLESVPRELAQLASERLNIPTIGIGAGPDCDGQVLVTHDMLGLFDRFRPSFVKRYAEVQTVMVAAFRAYKDDVLKGQFPTPDQCRSMEQDAWRNLLQELEISEK